MGFRFPVLHNGGDQVPVADGAYQTQSMQAGGDRSAYYADGVFVIEFFDEADNPVTPTGGTITPLGYLTPNQKTGPGVGDATIQATDCVAASDGPSLYNTPRFIGDMLKGEIVLSGITGALYCKATFVRF